MIFRILEGAIRCMILRLLEVEEETVDRRGQAMRSPVRESATHCMILWALEVVEGAVYWCVYLSERALSGA
jgi:hypothetical protein